MTGKPTNPPRLAPLIREAAKKAAVAANEGARMLSDSGVVLFGAGGLGRITLRGLVACGIRVEAFTDNNQARWNQAVDGIPVLSPERVIDEFGDRVIIVTIWGASPRRNHVDVFDQLRSLGCKRIVSFTVPFRRFPDVFLPYYALDRFENVLAAAEEIEEAYSLLEDESSREVFRRQVEWRITADFEILTPPVEEPQYFSSDVYHLRSDETVVDCGAFDGDTLRQLLALTGGRLEKYWALEPDEQNHRRLVEMVEGLPEPIASRVICLAIAASDRHGRETFAATGSASSTFSEEGGISIDCAPLDELVGEATLIKMDVEGAEERVLRGARRLIEHSEPVLAIAAYHHQSDLWRLPLLVRSINPTYRFYYREHAAEGFDLVLYAIPAARQL